MKKIIFAILITLLAFAAFAADPPKEPGVTYVKANPALAEPYKGVAVELYGTSWCGFCKKARAFLKSKNVTYTDFDVEKNPDAYDRFRQISKSGGVPVLVVGEYYVPGYQEDAYLKALEASRPPIGPLKN